MVVQALLRSAPVGDAEGAWCVSPNKISIDNAVDRSRDGGAVVPLVLWSEAFRTWARIAALSFGGPAGQIAVMHRILVEEKRWIGEARFLHALNYCMLLPGPEAHQLAVYVGWLMHRVRGGILAGTLFVLPGLVSLGILSWAYAAFGNVGFVAALFFGLKAAVLAIVLQAVLRIGRRALKSSALTAIAGLAFIAIFVFAIPFPLVVATAAVAGLIGQRLTPSWFKSGGHGEGAKVGDADGLIDRVFEKGLPDHVRPSAMRFAKTLVVGLLIWFAPLLLLAGTGGLHGPFAAIAVFNSKMAVVTFGGAYAVLAYMAQQAVEHYHWLRPGEMLVGLGFAETTPGPLISVVQFAGYMAAYRQPGTLAPVLAGTLGGLLAMWSTFVPSFLWIFLGGPYIEALIGNRALKAALSAVTAAVVGVILNLAVWFALHTLFGVVDPIHLGIITLGVPRWGTINWAALAISIATIIATLRFKVGMIPVLAASCIAGLGIYLAIGIH
jgi:chromate transporter